MPCSRIVLRHKSMFSWPPPVVGHVWLSFFRLQLRQWVTTDMSLSAQVPTRCQNKQFAVSTNFWPTL